MAKYLRHTGGGLATNQVANGSSVTQHVYSVRLSLASRRVVKTAAGSMLSYHVTDRAAVNNARVVVASRSYAGLLPWGAVREAIEQWKNLPADWDGEETPAVAQGAFDWLEKLVVVGRAMNMPAPTPFFAADGEVGFRWKKDSRRATFSVRSDGGIVAFAALPIRGEAVRIRNEDEWHSHAKDFLRAIDRHFS